MRAVRLVQPGQPLEMFDMPTPEVGNQDVLVNVKAAGICHSDAHYRAGKSPVDPLPLTLGHEVSGTVEQIGSSVSNVKVGNRVCIHYMVTCGKCFYCIQGNEQFCVSGKMIGKYRDGGYAEYMSVPERSVFQLPDDIPFDQGAIMMCSSATSLHALRKSRLVAGETVAVFGVGGLGISAVQLARAMGAIKVFAVDINPKKLKFAERFDAIPIDARDLDPIDIIKRQTNGNGVDVAVELIGDPITMEQAFRSLSIFGRVVIAGITEKSFTISPYYDLINRETEIIGVSDHLAQEIPGLISWVQNGKLNLVDVITKSIRLDEVEINQVLDDIDTFSDQVRVVINP
jgi:propanol-preferring alcohol dehydrogenase